MKTNFPEFEPLTLEQRDIYMGMASAYPPVSDLSFNTLQIWWNLDNKLGTAALLGNTVINYVQPFDPENNGFTLIGTEKVDESIKTIFDFQQSREEVQRLIHVPDFVVKEIKNPEEFDIVEEPDYAEYVLDSVATQKQEGGIYRRMRIKVKKFKDATANSQLSETTHDLSDPVNQQKIYDSVISWEDENGTKNDPDLTERLALKKTLSLASSHQIENLCLYVDDELHAVILYEKSHDKQYIIGHHLKVKNSLPHIFDYMTQRLGHLAVIQNIPFINVEMDLGIDGLRQHKQAMRPIRFFKKFTVTPKIKY